MIYNNAVELIGRTPIVRINRVVKGVEVYAKLEGSNPGSSVKDRIAKAMVETAEREGIIRPGDTLIEATSGNTGIGLAMVAAVKGYNLILVMPESMSVERRNIFRWFGAELILTPATGGMRAALAKATELANEHGYFLTRQFENLANPEIHRLTTAEEILEDLGTDIDYLVAGVGTGGTITGVGEILKQEIPNLKVVAVEPEDSAVLSGKQPGSHRIQGIGAGFIPPVLNMNIIDQVITVSNEDAFAMSKRLTVEEGLFVGISSGAAMVGVQKLAKTLEDSKKILTILPDAGERYLSIFSQILE